LVHDAVQEKPCKFRPALQQPGWRPSPAPTLSDITEWNWQMYGASQQTASHDMMLGCQVMSWIVRPGVWEADAELMSVACML
jgi:hypothetical protein